MTRAVRMRLMAFVILSAVGITYVTASYLGVVDRITGRRLEVTATLPGSGGLFVGSEVTYRGVKIGKVAAMTPTAKGVTLGLDLDPDSRLPVESKMYVHNLSAVGEQYLDFQPPDDQPPYAEDGTVYHGSSDSLPVDEGDLLVDLNDFVQSVDQENLQVTVRELGRMFRGTGDDLQRLLDGGTAFIEEASAHTAETVKLLDSGLTVLRTQRGQKENIRSFSADLATVTAALRRSDGDLRTVIGQTPGAAREAQALLEDLEPTLPVLLNDLSTTTQTVLTHLDGVEQLLVTYPVIINGGPNGITEDGWGRINLQFDYEVPPCTQGYLRPSEWRSTQDLTDAPIFPASCTAGAPYVPRGSKSAPGGSGANASAPRAYTSAYDAATGDVAGVVDAEGNPVRFNPPAAMSVLGGDAWKWMLVGPVKGR
ncbi:MCE family protein [Nocardioides sp. GY 10113]|uniref:MCE family protein n=1 Tax=Nocardioides sp. GY 10113 TaxID=2569761 RepID=UPI0010A8ACBA|nr:MlaD family protein [Nocardioides sp. GY 10113]TIC83888.1 MCE family protein [Nocardioides sp. GY 10113]